MTKDIHQIANDIAAQLSKIEGIDVGIDHSTNSVGKSSYIGVTACEGKFYANFRIRVSDHEISSSRHIREGYQHFILNDPTAEQLVAIIDMANRAVAHVKGKAKAVS